MTVPPWQPAQRNDIVPMVIDLVSSDEESVEEGSHEGASEAEGKSNFPLGCFAD